MYQELKIMSHAGRNTEYFELIASGSFALCQWWNSGVIAIR